jgi:hypothetical protein
MSAPHFSLERFSRHRLRLGGELPAYCTVSITTSPCAAPPAAVAVTVICDVPSTVGAATVTKDDPAVPAAGVAVTVTVAGFGTTAGGVYSPVPLDRAIRTAARDRPGYALVSHELLLITSPDNCLWPRITRLIRKHYNAVGGFTVTGVVVLTLPATPPQEISAINPSARNAPPNPP